MKMLLPVALLLLGGCSSPKFKVGDCVVYEWANSVEKWEKRSPYFFSQKILELGKHSYRAAYWYGAGTDQLAREEREDNLSYEFARYWHVKDCTELEGAANPGEDKAPKKVLQRFRLGPSYMPI